MRQVRRRVTAVTAAVLLLALPAAAAAAPGGQGQGKPTDGARTLGDPLLPQIGNGGYDVDALPDLARLRPRGQRVQ